MNADSAYRIGADHTACEDYTMHDPNGTWVLLGDGCSNQKRSDVGVRLLLQAASQNIKLLDDITIPSMAEYHAATLNTAAAYTQSLGMDVSCLAATLITVKITPKYCLMSMYGDGHVLIDHTDGSQVLISVSFAENAPFYPYYDLCDDKRALWESQYPNNIHRVETWHSTGQDNEDEPPILTPPSKAQPLFRWDYAHNVQRITLFSDGVENVETSDKRVLRAGQIIRELAGFKNTNGEFVQRRMNGWLRSCKAEGRSFKDDISVASINLEEI